MHAVLDDGQLQLHIRRRVFCPILSGRQLKQSHLYQGHRVRQFETGQSQSRIGQSVDRDWVDSLAIDYD